MRVLEYDIHFHHCRPALARVGDYLEELSSLTYHAKDQYITAPIQAMTRCFIAKEDNGSVAVGFAFCSVQDQFSRKDGRYVALKRAIAQLYPLPDPEGTITRAMVANQAENSRHKLWRAYHDTIRQQKGQVHARKVEADPQAPVDDPATQRGALAAGAGGE